jgi:predicted ATPase
LAAFAGGFGFAAEVVGAGDGLELYQVPDQLSQLVDKSLVLADESGGESRSRGRFVPVVGRLS